MRDKIRLVNILSLLLSWKYSAKHFYNMSNYKKNNPISMRYTMN